MKMNVTINGTEDFNVLCELFKVDPQALIQKFVDQVSFPFYYSQPDGDERWATLFFLYYIGLQGKNIEIEMPQHEPFMNQMAEVVFNHLEAGHQYAAKAEIAGREVMKAWHQHIMEKRAE